MVRPSKKTDVPADGEDDEETHYDQVKKFLRGWNLDVDNAVDMMRCSREIQKVVMDEFSQEGGSKNVNVDFHVFVWKFLQAGGCKKPPSATAPEPVPEPAASPPQEPASSPVPEPEQAPDAPPLDLFVEKWDLDEDAVDQLLEMPFEEQEEVMATFDPPQDSTLDNSSKFLAFLRSRTEQGADAEEAPAGDWTILFAEKWGLNEEALAWLEKVPEEEQEAIAAAFRPSARTRDVNRRFVSYIRAKLGPEHQDDGHVSEAEAVEGEGLNEELQSFVQKWHLNEEAISWLEWLSPEQQDVVMAEFKPSSDVQDVSKKFVAFARTRKPPCHRLPEKMPADVEEFREKFGLSDDAVSWLFWLSDEQQDYVLREFNPRPGVQDVNSKFIAFAKSRKHISSTHEEKRVSGQASKSRMDPVQEFKERFGLNDEAISWLLWLPGDLQQQVMDEFNPTAVTKDINGKLMAFVKTKKKPDNRAPKQRKSAIDEFADKWALNEEAMSWLRWIPSDERAQVMDSFQPRDTTRDVSSLFVSYVKSRQDPRNQVAKRTPDPLEEFADKFGLTEEAMSWLRWLSPEEQSRVMSEFDPPAHTRDISSKFISFAKSRKESRHTAARKQSSPVDEFAEKFGLNDEAVSRLLGLAPEQQKHIMAEFNPAANTRDISGKLMAFIKTREGREQSNSVASGQRSKAVDELMGRIGGDRRNKEDTALHEFADRFGLSEDSMSWLRWLGPEQQEYVMSEFNAGPSTKDVNKRFVAFVKTRKPEHTTPRPRRSNPIEEFIESWGLNDEAKSWLLWLSPERQEEAMNSFTPPPHTIDRSKLFVSFVRKRKWADGTEAAPDWKRRRSH